MTVASNHLIVGLTGGIAGGKSTVSAMLRDLGARLIDFDALAREVVAPGTPGLAAVVESFGKQVLLSDGTLDRKKLSRIVFQDSARRRELERLIHPNILAAFQSKVTRILKQQPNAIIVAEVPLLVEADLLYLFDKIILVFPANRQQIRRLMDRDRISRKAAAEMINAQLSMEEKKKFADYVISNDGDLHATRQNVRAVWEQLTALQRGDSGGSAIHNPL